MKVVYIAGPFRGKTAWDIECNVRRAEAISLEVGSMGAMPLATHGLTRYFHGQISEEFWVEGTLELMRRSDAVLLIPGWERSGGSVGEKDEAFKLGIPVFTSLSALQEWLVS